MPKPKTTLLRLARDQFDEAANHLREATKISDVLVARVCAKDGLAYLESFCRSSGLDRPVKVTEEKP